MSYMSSLRSTVFCGAVAFLGVVFLGLGLCVSSSESGTAYASSSLLDWEGLRPKPRAPEIPEMAEVITLRPFRAAGEDSVEFRRRFLRDDPFSYSVGLDRFLPVGVIFGAIAIVVCELSTELDPCQMSRDFERNPRSTR